MHSPLRSGDPSTLGGYHLSARIGDGGQGVVYLGASASGEQVAIKWLRPDLAGDTQVQERFLREVTSAKRVAPFCTAQVIESGIDQDRPYIVSEYIDGPSLQRRVTESGPMGGSALHRLAVGTATALAAIHQAGIVHRDFKPANVIMGPDGPRVIDFGIAKALDASSTLTSRPVGTPSYMSPEQIMGHPVGPSTDLFAWACTIIYAATGQAPFGSDSLPAVINRILNGRAELGDLAGPLRDVVVACLAKDPNTRPSAEQVLLRLLSGQTVPDRPERQEPVLQQGAAVAAAPTGPSGSSGPVGPAGTRRLDPNVPPPPGLRQMPFRPPPPQPAAPPAGQPHVPYPPPPLPSTLPTRVASPRRPGRMVAILAGVSVVLLIAVVFLVRGVINSGTSNPTGSPTPTPTSRSESPTPTATPSPSPVVRERSLAGVSATLYESSSDPLTLTYYEVWDSAKKLWVNYPRKSKTGTFVKSGKYWQQSVSPDGLTVAGRTKKYTADDYHAVDLVTRATGAVRPVKTVKNPLTYEYPEWAHDSRRLLLSIRKSGSPWTTRGFIVIDVVSGTAQVHEINTSDIQGGRFYWNGDETGVVTPYTRGKKTGLRFYNLDGSEEREMEVGETYSVSSGLFSPAGDAVVTKCRDDADKTCVWNASSGVETLRFSSDCTKILGWWDEQHLYCWATDSSNETTVSVVDLNGVRTRKVLSTTQSADLAPYFTRNPTS